MNGVTLLENVCAYSTPSVTKMENCSEVYIRPDHRIEILVEVKNAKNGNVSYVPFVFDPRISQTTFSERALMKTQLKEGDEIIIMNNTIKVAKGEVNAMGMDFLKEAIVAYNFLSYKAGVAFIKGNGTAYSIGLPLKGLMDKNIEKKNKDAKHKLQELNRKYKEYTKKLLEKAKKIEKKIKRMDQIIGKYSKYIVRLQEGKTVPDVKEDEGENVENETEENETEENETEEVIEDGHEEKAETEGTNE